MFPTEEEGVCNKPPILLSNCSKVFEEQCPYYMVMGMTFDEYWEGANELPGYYRRAYEIKQDKINHEFWLQGKYFYDVMMMVAPSFNSLSPQEPIPYHDEPLPITMKQVEERRIREEERRFERNKAMMMKFESEVNAYFNQETEQKGGR